MSLLRIYNDPPRQMVLYTSYMPIVWTFGRVEAGKHEHARVGAIETVLWPVELCLN